MVSGLLSEVLSRQKRMPERTKIAHSNLCLLATLLVIYPRPTRNGLPLIVSGLDNYFTLELGIKERKSEK